MIGTLSALGLAAGAGCGSSSAGESPGDDGGADANVEGGEDSPGPDTGPGSEAGADGMGMKDGPSMNDGPSGSDATNDGNDASAALAIYQDTTNGAFAMIFDAVPSPDGKKVYFTGVDSNGNIGAYWTPVGNGIQPVTQASSGNVLVAPLGVAVSTDGNTLYIADPGAIDSTGGDDGVIWSLALPNATPAMVAGSGGIYARGMTVDNTGGSDTLVFTGANGAGQAGLFTLAALGGTAMTVASGAPFDDPSGVTVAPNGDYYVFDVSAGGTHRADVIKVSGGTATAVLADLFVGYPAGITMNGAGNAIVLSGLASAEGPDTLTIVDALGQTSPLVSSGLSNRYAAGGLHRAANANVYAFVDSAGDGTDAVFVIR